MACLPLDGGREKGEVAQGSRTGRTFEEVKEAGGAVGGFVKEENGNEFIWLDPHSDSRTRLKVQE